MKTNEFTRKINQILNKFKISIYLISIMIKFGAL